LSHNLLGFETVKIGALDLRSRAKNGRTTKASKKNDGVSLRVDIAITFSEC